MQRGIEYDPSTRRDTCACRVLTSEMTAASAGLQTLLDGTDWGEGSPLGRSREEEGQTLASLSAASSSRVKGEEGESRKGPAFPLDS